MAKIHGVNVMQLKKPSAVLRLAATILEEGQSTGCCGAFSIIEDSVCDTLEWDDRIYTHEAIKAVDRAQKLFKSLYAPYYESGLYPRKDGGKPQAFWFGAIYQKVNQQHRITALLLTADMAESVGE